MTRKLNALLDSFLKFLNDVSNWAFLIAGLAILALSVGYSFIVPYQVLGVSLASAGSIVGTAIVCLMIPKLVDARLKMKLDEEIQKRTDIALQLQNAQATAAKNKELEAEIQYLRRQQVSISVVREILNVDLLEIDHKWVDFCTFREEEKKPWYAPDEVHEYIGVVEAQFKGRLGIDLARLRFHDQGDTLILSGMHPLFHSGPRTITPLLCEGRIRKHSETPLLADSYTVDKNHSMLAFWKDEHLRRVDQRINDGVEFKWLHDDLRRRACDFLQILLQPLGKKLVFDNIYTGGPGCGLNEYIESHNRRIEVNIAELH